MLPPAASPSSTPRGELKSCKYQKWTAREWQVCYCRRRYAQGTSFSTQDAAICFRQWPRPSHLHDEGKYFPSLSGFVTCNMPPWTDVSSNIHDFAGTESLHHKGGVSSAVVVCFLATHPLTALRARSAVLLLLDAAPSLSSSLLYSSCSPMSWPSSQCCSRMPVDAAPIAIAQFSTPSVRVLIVNMFFTKRACGVRWHAGAIASIIQ